jgi:integrase
VYKVGVDHYHKFLKHIGGVKQPPVSQIEKFLLFIVYLSQVCALGYGTIKVYVAGVRNWFIQRGRKDPYLSNGRKSPQVQLLLRGIKRDRVARRVRVRHPLTLERLSGVVQAVSAVNVTLVEKIRLRTAMLLAFWGFLRSSEYCMGGTSPLRRKDVKIRKLNEHSSYVALTLRKSKTSQFNAVKVYIYSNPSPYCAVKAVKAFMKLTADAKHCKPESPFFLLPDNPALSASYFNNLLKIAVKKAGLNPDHFSSHSLRSGAATTAANSGVPPYLIQKLGRWKSDCYQIYIQNPKAAFKRAHSIMAPNTRR